MHPYTQRWEKNSSGGEKNFLFITLAIPFFSTNSNKNDMHTSDEKWETFVRQVMLLFTQQLKK